MTATVRLATAQDAAKILEIYSPYVTNTTISFESSPPSEEEMRARINKLSETHPWLVYEAGQEILGYAYASKHRERSAYRWSTDVSIYVRQNCQAQGIGKRLYAALFNILKLQGYCNAYAGIAQPNAASVGIHEYFGFKSMANYAKVGYKLGQWLDVGWWELHLAAHELAPNEPLRIGQLGREQLLKALGEFSG